MNADVDTALGVATSLLVTYGLRVLAALVILIVGLWIAGRIGNAVRRTLDRSGKVDPMLSGFLAIVSKYLILTVTVLAVISQFGVEITSLLVIFGSVGLAVGLALQGTLSNVAAGVMLLIFRPFKIGEYVEIGGHAGTVKEVGLFVTELATPDNVQIIVPNGQIWGQSVKNYSFHATRRVDFNIGISYDSDIDKAKSVIAGVIATDSRIHRDPEPQIVVGNLGESSVDLIVRVWCANADYWPLKFDLTKAFKEALDANGITIPFPTRTVYSAAAE
jgi:small conductance mechanosensitive channel